MLWHEIWIWPIQFLLFYVNQSFWGVCIREYRMCSYVLYMIMTSLFILKQFLFSERSCQLLPKHRDIFRNLKQWSDKLRTAFFKLLYTESRAPLQGFHFMVQHFSMWHFTINMKSICLCISDRSCQFLPRHLDIFRNLKLCSLFDKLHTTFFKLLYSESHEHHKALISWYSIFPCSRALIRHGE